MNRCEQCQKPTEHRRKRHPETALLVCPVCFDKRYNQQDEPSPEPAKKPAKSRMAERLSSWKRAVLAPHLMVIARAGTGKTTTLVEGLKVIKGKQPSITPSPQQAAIWEKMQEGDTPRTICFVAFNKSIATELQERVPQGCDAMTMHSMGFKAVQKAFGRLKVSSWRVQDIISEILEKDIRELRRTKPTLIQATEKLVSLCKMNLVGCYPDGASYDDDMGREGWYEELSRLAAHYDVDLNGSTEEVFALVPKVLERCKDVARDGCVDFNDMIWLPVVLNLPVFRYDLLLVDEAQDLNRCQQQLALKAGKRLVLCGDPKQAIYGFAGADAESMDRMAELLSGKFLTMVPSSPLPPVAEYLGTKGSVATMRPGPGCNILPLNVTRRCGKAIVAEANKYVPDFEAHESNRAGSVGRARLESGNKSGKGLSDEGCYHGYVQDGDMILCRVNAPLVSQCFRFLRAGRKATIQGRDVGQGLISTIKKMKTEDVGELMGKLGDWLSVECRKESQKRNPSDARLIALQDRYDCLMAFCEEALTVSAVVESIEKVFNDNETDGIKLSSVHKAKGLEADRVFILQPEGASMPHPMARSAWQRDQEYNLLYVAITRAISELVYVY